jgi:hypothetical protein
MLLFRGDDLIVIAAARDCAELYAVMQRDFWVVTPCHSVRKPGHVMEGTRLTLVVPAPVSHRSTPGV